MDGDSAAGAVPDKTAVETVRSPTFVLAVVLVKTAVVVEPVLAAAVQAVCVPLRNPLVGAVPLIKAVATSAAVTFPVA
jgi:hypothetical protein